MPAQGRNAKNAGIAARVIYVEYSKDVLRPGEVGHKGFYESPESIRRMDTHALVDIEHNTLKECLRDYYQHPEAKAANPDGTGILERQHLASVEHAYIGKETNDVKEETVDESEETLGYEDACVYGRRGLRDALKAHGVRAVAAVSAKIAAEHDGEKPLPLQTLYDIASSCTERAGKETVRKVLIALSTCQPAHGCCEDEATLTAVELYERKRNWRREQRHALQGSCLLNGTAKSVDSDFKSDEHGKMG